MGSTFPQTDKIRAEVVTSNHSEIENLMARRGFLKSMGGALGLVTAATLFGPATLRRLEAATQSIAGLSPQQVAQDEFFWREIQQAFSVSRSIINLNNGGVCPSPRIVTAAVERYLWQQEEAPAYQLWEVLEPRIETVRVELARLFGCDPEEIAIVRNTTEALQTVLLGVDLQPGDQVLTTIQDYWAMFDALEQRRQREGITIKKIKVPIPPKSMDELAEAFEQGITPKTRLILVSHPVNLTGQFFPIKRICDLAHRRGIEVVVDGAHSFAQLDFKHRDLDCDYFGTSLHKWLFAPKGTGMLYIRRDKIDKVWPLMPALQEMKDNVRKFEMIGTKSAAPYLAIAEALAFHNGIGAKRKEERLRYLTHYWAKRLQALPTIRFYTSLAPEMSCALATFGLGDIDPTAFRNYLWEQHRIQTARIDKAFIGIRGLRISPNLSTTLGELDYFCEVVEEVARKGLPEPYRSYGPRRLKGW